MIEEPNGGIHAYPCDKKNKNERWIYYIEKENSVKLERGRLDAPATDATRKPWSSQQELDGGGAERDRDRRGSHIRASALV